MFHIAAFYQFAPLPDFADRRSSLIALATSQGVKGSILLAHEGVNGTIAGTHEGVETVIDAIKDIPGFESMEPKWSVADTDPFLRLKVRLKSEIVTLGVGDVDSVQHTGTKVPASEWNELISNPRCPPRRHKERLRSRHRNLRGGHRPRNPFVPPVPGVDRLR